MSHPALTILYPFRYNVARQMVDGLGHGGSDAETDFATIAYELRCKAAAVHPDQSCLLSADETIYTSTMTCLPCFLTVAHC
jgi:hypothetical protein